MKQVWDKFVLWLYMVVTGFVFGLAAFQKRGRSTHLYGVGGIGTLQVVDNPEFPEHEFWQGGRRWPVQIRHGTVSFEDDAAMDLRSAALKLSDQEEESPLDLVMNTGPRTFTNMITFRDFTLASVRGRAEGEVTSSKGLKAFCQSNPVMKEILAETMRRAPESFAQMYYDTKLVNYFKAKDGQLRYVKYRLIPGDRGIDSGVATGADWSAPWLQNRLPEETRPTNYLRQEYLDRLTKAPVVYHLQLRLHEDTKNNRQEIFTQEKEWDQTSSPWLDLATVTIDKALSFEQTEKLSYNIGRQPNSLGIVEGHSILDPNSINTVRVRVYRLSRAIRYFTYRFLGRLLAVSKA